MFAPVQSAAVVPLIGFSLFCGCVFFFFFFSPPLNFLTVILKQKAERSLQLKLLSVDGFEYSIKKKPVFLPSDIKNQCIPCTM